MTQLTSRTVFRLKEIYDELLRLRSLDQNRMYKQDMVVLQDDIIDLEQRKLEIISFKNELKEIIKSKNAKGLQILIQEIEEVAKE